MSQQTNGMRSDQSHQLHPFETNWHSLQSTNDSVPRKDMAIDLVTVYGASPRKYSSVNSTYTNTNSNGNSVILQSTSHEYFHDDNRIAISVNDGVEHKAKKVVKKPNYARPKFIFPDNFGLRHILRSLSAKTVKEVDSFHNGTPISCGINPKRVNQNGKQTETKHLNGLVDSNHNNFTKVVRKVSTNCEQIVTNLKQLNNTTNSTQPTNEKTNVKSHILAPKITKTKENVSFNTDCDNGSVQSDQIMLDSVLEDKCSLKFQAKEKLLITSSSSSSSTETIKADDQVLMLDQGVLVDNLCAVLQLKKSVEIDERDVIQQVHINQQKGPLKSILINSSPTQITENDALDNKSVMTEDNEIQQDELNLNCTNDEEILETLRQVVRICTKTDLSKRASAIEVCDKLEAKLQTVQVLSPTSDNSQHPPLEPQQLTVQVDHHSFS